MLLKVKNHNSKSGLIKFIEYMFDYFMNKIFLLTKQYFYLMRYKENKN